jgi:hypothetical protein
MKTRNEILLAIQYAENFTPHKIEYYKQMLIEFDIMINIMGGMTKNEAIKILKDNNIKF